MKRNILLITFVVVVGLALTFSPLAFAIDCKGLSKGKCDGSPECSWVKSYKTKTGKTVNGYCRAKPGKNKSAATVKKKNADARDMSKNNKPADKNTGSTKTATKK
ncbi:hypothetical protein Dvar_02950 [Desulfosarcina variabilis str. Montpellier]|uniref:hypothetical protein n=1 Tax=Desulfosarcina variabilis TaxID=2300 RepID=UPI003AFAF6B2